LIRVYSLVERIQALLQERNTEDPLGELNLVIKHLEGVQFAKNAVDRIVQGIVSDTPITRVLGYNIVCGTRIMLNEYVLNPGPETIKIAEATIAAARNIEKPRVLDMCTGSGAIAIAVAKNVPGSFCVGVDISEGAIRVAKQNALFNLVEVDFRLGDLFEPLKGDSFDIIVANPPYVRSNDVCRLPYFVRDFAPLIAIDGGPDGLRLQERIICDSRPFLRLDGYLILECEDDQDIELQKLFTYYKWRVVSRYKNRKNKVRGFLLEPSPSKGSP